MQEDQDRSKLDTLVSLLTEINQRLKKQESFFRFFLKGVFYGLGFVVGTTIVAGIAYAILTLFVSPQFIENLTLKHQVELSK